MALFRYPGKKTWYYEFHFAGQKVRESAKTRSKEIARRAENARKREMEEGYHGLKKRSAPKLFNVAADEWLALKKPTLAERSYAIEEANLKHIRPCSGSNSLQISTGRTSADISSNVWRRRLHPKPSTSKSVPFAPFFGVTGYGLRFSLTCGCFLPETISGGL